MATMVRMTSSSSAPPDTHPYERLTPDVVLDALAAGETPKAGTQEPGRQTSEPANALSSLKEMVSENHDYRGEW